MKPGIYPNLSFGDYQRIDAVNQSLLKHFAHSPAHARYEMLHPSEPSASMTMGTAVHAAVLEPDRFKADYVVAPKCDKRTNAGKAEWADFEAANKGKDWLPEAEYQNALAMASAVRAHPQARALLDGRGKNELTAVWLDEETGVKCKARIDRLTTITDCIDGHDHNWPTIVDIKTTRDASRDKFAKSMIDYGYHIQAAFYIDGLYAIQPVNRLWHIIAVENVPPFGAAVYRIAPASIELGRAKYREHLRRYANCMESGVWPGYPQDIVELDVPAWALRELETV